MSDNEGEIDWYLNTLGQEHPKLLQDLQDYYLSFATDLTRKIYHNKLGGKHIYVRLSIYIY